MAAVEPRVCFCILCKKQTTQLGIKTHFLRQHGTEQDKSRWNGVIKSHNDVKTSNIVSYEKSPNFCKSCSQPLPYHQRNNTFCNSSCAARFNNTGRPRPKTEETKAKIRNTHLSKPKSQKHQELQKQKQELQNTVFTRVYLCRCKFCSAEFYKPSRFKICIGCVDKHSRARDAYRFKFNVYHYPDLFDLTLISTFGWYSQGGRKKTKNTNGIVRDHKVSVSEAIKHGYDPYYISHPLNCELMIYAF